MIVILKPVIDAFNNEFHECFVGFSGVLPDLIKDLDAAVLDIEIRELPIDKAHIQRDMIDQV